MVSPLVTGTLAAGFGVVLSALLLRTLATRDLESQIRGLEEQVVAWQSMHDHQVASMDRRLLDLEECAARAEEESRMVSQQMLRISRAIERSSDRQDGRNPRRGRVRGPRITPVDDADDDREAVLAGGGW